MVRRDPRSLEAETTPTGSRPAGAGRGQVPPGLVAVGLLSVLFTCAGSSGALRAGRPGSTQEGMATYYAARLAGHRTASGEVYDPARLTAAHPLLPFGARVRVTRIEDASRSVVVRINDRCAGRKKIIDLSEAAARRLGMLQAGIVRVRLRVVSATGD